MTPIVFRQGPQTGQKRLRFGEQRHRFFDPLGQLGERQVENRLIFGAWFGHGQDLLSIHTSDRKAYLRAPGPQGLPSVTFFAPSLDVKETPHVPC